MEIEMDLELTFGKDIDVTKLTYYQMMYYSKHNVHLFIKSLTILHSTKPTKAK